MPAAPKRVRFRFLFYLGLFLLALVGGTFGFMVLEGMGPLESLYFVIVTMATVGYGDLSPQTAAGQALAIMIILVGVGTFLSMVGNAAELFLSKREHESRMQKLNMVIGLFFSELGTSLLTVCSDADPEREKIAEILPDKREWTQEDFRRANRRMRDLEYQLDPDRVDLSEILQLLHGQRRFVVQLLENPAVMEHESFTEVLWAVFHLVDELEARDDVTDLLSFDRAHILGDTQRVYKCLVRQWMRYMEHLQERYPYLFSRAVRQNPFVVNKDKILEQAEDHIEYE